MAEGRVVNEANQILASRILIECVDFKRIEDNLVLFELFSKKDYMR